MGLATSRWYVLTDGNPEEAEIYTITTLVAYKTQTHLQDPRYALFEIPFRLSSLLFLSGT